MISSACQGQRSSWEVHEAAALLLRILTSADVGGLTGASGWWTTGLWVLLGSVVGAGITAGWRTTCYAGHLKDLLSSRGSHPRPSHHQVTHLDSMPRGNEILSAWLLNSSLTQPTQNHQTDKGLRSVLRSIDDPGPPDAANHTISYITIGMTCQYKV